MNRGVTRSRLKGKCDRKAEELRLCLELATPEALARAVDAINAKRPDIGDGPYRAVALALDPNQVGG